MSQLMEINRFLTCFNVAFFMEPKKHPQENDPCQEPSQNHQAPGVWQEHRLLAHPQKHGRHCITTGRVYHMLKDKGFP